MVNRTIDSLLTVRATVMAVAMTVFCLFLCTAETRAEDEDLRSLELYNGGSPELVSVGRSPRPASQTAENITVVTSTEIQAMNPHTLADVLANVVGVQLQSYRTPGSWVSFQIQGAGPTHILVLLDNVPLNNLSDNIVDVSSIPIQMVDRLEIVKGAASSSWGSALGGIINIITKVPQSDRAVAGEVSSSVGESGTSDTRAEVSGSGERFGYYLAGTKLHSDGLLPNNQVDLKHLYGKLVYDMAGRGSVALSAGWTGNSSGQFGDPDGTVFGLPVKGDVDQHQLISTLALHYALSDHSSFDAALKERRLNADLLLARFNQGTTLKHPQTDEWERGASVAISQQYDLQRVTFGVDYDQVASHGKDPQLHLDLLDREASRVGVYLNDTVTLGAFAVTPSARYDHTATGGDQVSPSLGVTYALSDNTVLRGYTARGYSLTSLDRLDSTEKVWTSQVGVEMGEIPYLWLKGTLFRNDTWNVYSSNHPKQRLLKQGGELEFRTFPFWNTSLTGGYTFIDARNADTESRVPGIARHTVKAGLLYQDRQLFRALLTANYTEWIQGSGQPAHNDVILDLHLGKKWQLSELVSVELFGSVRNLFNGHQFVSNLYKSYDRWGEVGVRCSF